MALAHTVGDKVEAAYRRGDMFEKRRQLAYAWARYCEATGHGYGSAASCWRLMRFSHPDTGRLRSAL
jgi:hypothetical protein